MRTTQTMFCDPFPIHTRDILLIIHIHWDYPSLSMYRTYTWTIAWVPHTFRTLFHVVLPTYPVRDLKIVVAHRKRFLQLSESDHYERHF